MDKAIKVIDLLGSISLKNNLRWIHPLINHTEDNEICLEWWNNKKKLTIYVSEISIDYIKVWGADMDNEMEDGLVSFNSLDKDLERLWQWLHESLSTIS